MSELALRAGPTGWGGAMCIIALNDQAEVIERILTYLGLWSHPAHAPPDGAVA